MKHIIDRNAEKLVPGLILYSSWGYDQTNIDFYIVTKVMGAMVEIAKIEARETPTDIMLGTKFPNLRPVVITGQRLRKKPHGVNVRLTNFSSAYPWDGNAMDVSHTH